MQTALADQRGTADLIDLTSMEHIKNYFLFDSAIKAIVNVCDEDLAFVGDLMCENTRYADSFRMISELIREKKIQLWFTCHEITIPCTNCVYCIRLEPYYIVKDLKKKYE